MSPDRIAWHEIVRHCAGLLAQEQYPSGDLAALRRIDPEAPRDGAFWRLVAAHAPDLPDRAVRALATAVQGMAIMHPFHHGQGSPRRLGVALAEAGVSEQRLLRLLECPGEQLPGELRRLARLLGSKGALGQFDWTDGARLVWTAETEAGAKLRSEIARDYYRTAYHQEKDEAA